VVNKIAVISYSCDLRCLFGLRLVNKSIGVL